MKIKVLPIILTIFFIIIFLIFYKGLQNSNIYTPNTNIEQIIPSFEAEEFDSNNKLKSDQIFLDNKYYLLNIWASWCVPCRQEHNFLINLYKQNDIEIIGLNYKDDNKKAKIFLEELKSPYKLILSDRDGTIAIEWGAYGVPETFLIYNKKIIKKIIGPINKNSFAEIKRLIK
jgi:cytochrome c biogenesis protein CcmG, thiol:disulfide interchange protein DsbE|tara:strand:+ start:72 stop:590 length:519 start_codon:yes stop_codon:yes gene_type:complete